MLANVDPDYPEAPAFDAGRIDRAALAGRRFLIVSAPFGPFGNVFASVLRSAGADVSRMLFNAGDELDWKGDGAIRFKGIAADWADVYAGLAEAFTDVIVFGEGGDYNQAVLTSPRSDTRTVWVLENGYFRPDWVTIERNGVNASSGLPRHRDAYGVPAPDTPVTRSVGKILPHHVVNISRYYLIQLPGRLLYPRYVAPFTQPPWRQCAGHIGRYFSLALMPPSRSDAGRIAARGPFFIACLQREGDAQLLRYSPFSDNTAFLERVMDSFSAHAPADARLVVKNHPLDPGLVNLNRATRKLAKARGLADRVDFIDGGNLAQLCRASRGMVVNNSSAALSALGFGTPVKVLGEAFFDFDGLTDQAPLDAFWVAPAQPDADLFQRFRAHVIRRTQVNGNFHEPRSQRPTAQALARALALPGRV
ncbi:capsular biosynthesis protein [soil metagenome]